MVHKRLASPESELVCFMTKAIHTSNNVNGEEKMDIKTHYFDEASWELTDQTLEIVREYLKNNTDVRDVIVATTRGNTGLAASKVFTDRNLIVVSHQEGFAEANENELDDEKREEIERSGAKVLTATHAMAGIARGIRKKLGTWTPAELMAVAFRTFSQGTKVCAEIAMMAADAGLVRVDKDVICIAGTGRGADTAWIVRPAYTSSFPELRMKACLCKPYEF